MFCNLGSCEPVDNSPMCTGRVRHCEAGQIQDCGGQRGGHHSGQHRHRGYHRKAPPRGECQRPNQGKAPCAQTSTHSFASAQTSTHSFASVLKRVTILADPRQRRRGNRPAGLDARDWKCSQDQDQCRAHEAGAQGVHWSNRSLQVFPFRQQRARGFVARMGAGARSARLRFRPWARLTTVTAQSCTDNLTFRRISAAEAGRVPEVSFGDTVTKNKSNIEHMAASVSRNSEQLQVKLSAHDTTLVIPG